MYPRLFLDKTFVSPGRKRFVALIILLLGLIPLSQNTLAVGSSWQSDGFTLSGNWNDPLHWTNGVPKISGDTATISVAGSLYTVTLNISVALDAFTQSSTTATLNALAKTMTVNGPINLTGGDVNWTSSTWAGTGTFTTSIAKLILFGNCAINNAAFNQNGTLRIGGNGGNATTTVANGDAFTNNGILLMESLTAHQARLNITAGTMTNSVSGIIDIKPGLGGTRILGGSFINNGSINVDTDTSFSKTNGSYTNNGVFNIAVMAPATLTISTASETFNQNGGILDNRDVFSLSQATFNFNGGTLLGNPPIITSGKLNIGPSSTGAGVIFIRGNSTFSGDTQLGQTVTIKPSGSNATITAVNGFTNAGTFIFDSATTHQARLNITNGAMTNTGTVSIIPGGASGTRILGGSLINNGVVDVNTPTTFSKTGGSYTNNASFDIAAGGTLAINLASETFNQDGGTLDNLGAFNLSQTTFNFDGGTITGNPLVMTSGKLNIGPVSTGSGEFILRGSSTYSGNIDANQVVTIEPSAATSTITAANGFTNAGTFNFDSATAHQARLNITNGAMANTGTLNIKPGAGGARILGGSLINDGAVNIDTPTSFSKAGGSYTNNAAFNIAAPATLAINLASETFNQDGGTLNNLGGFNLSQTTFNFNGGTITGNPPIITSGKLNIGPASTGAGEFIIRGSGAYSGDTNANQTVSVKPSGVNTSITAANGFTNAGIFNFDSTTAHQARLNITNGTMANTGTVNIKPGAGGTRILGGSLVNDGAVNIDTTTSFSKTGGSYTNNAAFNIAAPATLAINLASETFNQNGGTLDNLGAFNLSQTTFNFNGGTLTGNPPVITSGKLNIGPASTGAGEFIIRGSGTYSGDINANQTVTIKPSGINTTITAANGFTNAGIFNFDSTTAHQARLNITNGTMANTGTINVKPGAGGTRIMSLVLKNQGTVNIATPLSLGKTSAAHTNDGEFNLTDPNGVVTLSGTSFTNTTNGIIAGTGTLNYGTVAFSNFGVVSPGLSAGILNFTGDYVHQGSLKIELFNNTVGSGYDQLAVTGAAFLNGSLSVSIFGGFVPDPNDEFVILTATDPITGVFAGGFIDSGGLSVHTVRGTTGGVFDVIYTANQVILTNFSEDSLGCGAPGTFFFESDIIQNCYVDLTDLEFLISQWLAENCSAPLFCGGADIDQDGLVDIYDWAFFASQWLFCSDPLNPACDAFLPPG